MKILSKKQVNRVLELIATLHDHVDWKEYDALVEITDIVCGLKGLNYMKNYIDAKIRELKQNGNKR